MNWARLYHVCHFDPPTDTKLIRTHWSHPDNMQHTVNTHTHKWGLLTRIPWKHPQSTPFRFIWTDVIKLTHAVGWILGRLLPKLTFPKLCHLPSQQTNQLQSTIIPLGATWMQSSPPAGAGRPNELIGVGHIKAGALWATSEPLLSREKAATAYTGQQTNITPQIWRQTTFYKYLPYVLQCFRLHIQPNSNQIGSEFWFKARTASSW